MNAPKPKPNPDFTALQELVIAGVEGAIAEHVAPKDFEVYAWEAAVEAIYGPEFWTWWNEQEWNQ